MALNNLEDRLECAIAHISTSVDIDPWAQNLAVESMRMRIAMLKTGQSDIIRCKDCKWKQGAECVRFADVRPFADDFCSRAERRTDG